MPAPRQLPLWPGSNQWSLFPTLPLRDLLFPRFLCVQVQEGIRAKPFRGVHQEVAVRVPREEVLLRGQLRGRVPGEVLPQPPQSEVLAVPLELPEVHQPAGVLRVLRGLRQHKGEVLLQ